MSVDFPMYSNEKIVNNVINNACGIEYVMCILERYIQRFIMILYIHQGFVCKYIFHNINMQI